MRAAVLVAISLIGVACGAGDNDETSSVPAGDGSATPPPTTAAPITYPPAPDAPTGPNDDAADRFDDIVASIPTGQFEPSVVDDFVAVADVRHAWLLSDLLRFISSAEAADVVIDGFTGLTGVDVTDQLDQGRSPWNVVTNHLLAWDTSAPPDYQQQKGELFELAEPKWSPFFADTDADIDWRWLSWGGVFIDDRPLGDPEPCGPPGCIPALDDPELVAADDGDYYDDDAIVFGVTEGDEAVALPKNVMQVHELVNITIGDRRFGIPYCTLCGSAQAFYTDEVPDGFETPVLRTSGLLSRSNKVMYDLTTSSVLDTFTGAAVSGPLQDAGLVLDQNSVTVSTWGDWKAAHPNTTIVAEDGGIGRSYRDDPLGGRDDNGPIFPIGDVDPRLGVQDPVLGVLLEDGTTIAFSVEELRAATADGDDVRFADVTVTPDGGGFVAEQDGDEIGTHEAFWFAWSQFHPDTLLWPNDA